MNSKYSTSQFHKDLKAGDVAPIYLFYGEEEFIINQLTEALLKSVLQPGDADFNLDVLYGNETDGATIVNIAMSYPMMAERRVVVVKQFHHLGEKDMPLLIKYAEKPSTSSCMVLTSDKFTGTNATIKKLSPYCKAIEAKTMYDNQIPAWVKNHVKERGFSISDEAVSLLQLNVGNSLRRLVSEIDKIELKNKERKEITVPDVEQVVGITKEFNIFEFCDSVAEQNIQKSLRILDRLLELGESPIGILVLLTRHFTIIAKAKEMVLAQLRRDQISKSLRVNPYFVEKYLRQAAKYKREQLNKVFHSLLQADIYLKSSYQKPRLVLESLLFEIHSTI